MLRLPLRPHRLFSSRDIQKCWLAKQLADEFPGIRNSAEIGIPDLASTTHCELSLGGVLLNSQGKIGFF
jgi:hypothetical protein